MGEGRQPKARWDGDQMRTDDQVEELGDLSLESKRFSHILSFEWRGGGGEGEGESWRKESFRGRAIYPVEAHVGSCCGIFENLRRGSRCISRKKCTARDIYSSKKCRPSLGSLIDAPGAAPCLQDFDHLLQFFNLLSQPFVAPPEVFVCLQHLSHIVVPTFDDRL